MKRWILVLGVLLLLLPAAHAALSVTDEAEKNIILPGEAAVYFLDLHNAGEKEGFGLTVTDANWRFKGKSNVDLGPGQTQRIKLELIPLGGLKPGSYSVNVRLYSKNTAEVVDKPLVVNYVAFSDLVDAQLEYNPAGLDPRRENLVKIHLRNKNSIPLDNLKMKLESSLFSDERRVDLLPLESRDEELRVSFIDFVERGSYEVRLLLTMRDKILIERAEKVAVGYYDDVSEDSLVEEKFLRKTTRLVRENRGNTVSDEEFSVRLSSFEKTFTSAHPLPTNIEQKDGLYYYIWAFKINPGDSYTITVETNYLRPLLIFLLVIVLAMLAYWMLKKDVLLEKKVLTIKSGEGISEMKILLIVKNKGAALKHFQVVDKLPKMIKKPAEFGMVKPVNFRHTEMGEGVITWGLENLVRGEERVISYKVKCDVHIVGRLHLPIAVLRYRNKTGKLVVIESNKNIVVS